MNALNAHDVDAMLAIYEEEALRTQSDDGTIGSFRSQIEQRGVLGWPYHFTREITDAGPVATWVQCPYSFTNHITEVFGLDPL